MVLSMLISSGIVLGLCRMTSSFVYTCPLSSAVQSRCTTNTYGSVRAFDGSPLQHYSHQRPPSTSTSGHSSTNMMAGFGEKKEKKAPPVPGAGKGQKAYQRQMQSFVGLREAGAEGVDVYVYRVTDDKARQDDKFIFAGKAAWSSGITVEKALQWHRDLIVDHVKLLEPSWRTSTLSPMRIFTAPLDSEVEVARNVHDLVWVLGGKGSKAAQAGPSAVNLDGMKNAEVGLKPELYNPGEDYFYVRKLEDGRSSAPPAEVMIESMDKFEAMGVEKAAAAEAEAAAGGRGEGEN